MLFMDTLVVAGTGKAIVKGTGKSTEIGKIARALEEIVEEQTRFHREIASLSNIIGKAVAVLVAIIACVVLFLHNAQPIEALIFSISLAVAAIPEGLPAVVTISLALATRKMLKQKSLVRKLPVIESLGSVDVICTDKTGTITENKMAVQEIYCNGEYLGAEEAREKAKKSEGIAELLFCGMAANDTMQGKSEGGKKTFNGEPTELALAIFAASAGISAEGVKRLREIPFSSQRKRMSVVAEMGGKVISYSKGAPEVILESCTHALLEGKKAKLDEKTRKQILGADAGMASKALRVLAFAKKELRGANGDEAESGMIFLGLQGMIDPPRSEVAGAIAIAKQAGIRVIMLTGDNKLTAKAIAGKIGIMGRVIGGEELEKMPKDEFGRAVGECNIFARVTPGQKFSILKALKAKGFSVAMTGDGVNDAPALKEADVGIAMGIRGSDVAKEASDIVLLDDNFATIVEAVRHGRGVFDNIQKFVFFMLSHNLAEVLVVFIASLAKAMAFTPVMLLWINLVTDGLPAIALGSDEPAANVMNRPPRKKNEEIVNGKSIRLMLTIGSIITAILLAIFFSYLPKGLALAQTVTFTAIVFYELMFISVIKRQEGISIFANKWIVAAVAASMLLQLAVLYTPAAAWFGVVALGLNEWLVIISGGALSYLLNTIAMKMMGQGKTLAAAG
ncbi:Potassium-transporting ATPase ATP-binding subunit [uncultured archaeon]|nr:Potassium-transporting ATPase ATP-binding subunit [uncultured archaeon]